VAARVDAPHIGSRAYERADRPVLHESDRSGRNLGRVTGTTRPRLAARGHLARLALLVAVLAGLALAVGIQCTDGMAMHSSAGMAAGHRCDVSVADAGHHDAAVCATDATTGGSSPEPSGLGCVLAVCLAFVIAVVATVAGLRPAGLQGVGRMLAPARVAGVREFRPRALSLAELCLLRT
jgi:hypothetical protein